MSDNSVDFVFLVESFDSLTGRLTGHVQTDHRFQVDALVQWTMGHQWQVNAKQLFPKRSSRANRKFHHIVYQISRSTGSDFEGIKDLLLKQAISFGVYKWEADKIVPKSEAECTSKDEGILIDLAIELAHERKVRI
jgi:hypothetical protein